MNWCTYLLNTNKFDLAEQTWPELNSQDALIVETFVF